LRFHIFLFATIVTALSSSRFKKQLRDQFNAHKADFIDWFISCAKILLTNIYIISPK